VDPLVECRYTLTRDDLIDGITAQQRGRWRRSWVAVLVLAGLLGIAIGVVRSAAWELLAGSALIVVVAGAVALLLDRSFVFLASKGLAAMAFVLPKRALVDGDPARLRTVLDAYCQRRA